MPSYDTQSSLLLRIRDVNDDTAWTLFVEVYTPIVFRYLRSRGLQDADAADITQEVLIEVARSIRGFEYQPERGRFRNWLALVTRRRLGRFWQKERKAIPLLPEVDGDDHQVDAEWLETYQSELLRIAIARIRPMFEKTTWEAFWRNWIDRIPATQVSHDLGMPIDLVYSAKSRVLKRLEAEVRLLGDDCVWVSSAR